MYLIRLAMFSGRFPKVQPARTGSGNCLSSLCFSCALGSSQRHGLRPVARVASRVLLPINRLRDPQCDRDRHQQRDRRLHQRQTTGAGLYTILPVLPGTYTVTATAQGFDTVVQKNLTVNALVLTPLDLPLTVGSATTEVTVTAAPPQLETTNATLGLTIENDAYANLPLIMNNAQRDPTAFGALAPGAQGGGFIAARLPVIGGTGNYLGQSVSTASQQRPSASRVITTSSRSPSASTLSTRCRLSPARPRPSSPAPALRTSP